MERLITICLLALVALPLSVTQRAVAADFSTSSESAPDPSIMDPCAMFV